MEENKPQKQRLKKIKKQSPKKKRTEQQLVIAEQCKNCGTSLGLDQRFCPSCGAKRIYNRLTPRNLLEDFTERFLNIDNAFLKTFIALFKQPEDVINGYIHGLRKKYMSAFSYFAVALTLGSIYIFFFKNWIADDINAMTEMIGGMNQGMEGQDFPGGLEFMDFFLDFNSFLSFLFIPFYAIISKIVFWNYKQVNFVEHIVIYLYTYSQTQIISNGLLIIFAWTSIGQIVVSSLISVLPFFYTAYVLYRVFALDIPRLVLKTLLFLAILLPFSCLFFSIIGGAMYGVGALDPFIDSIKLEVESKKAIKAAKAVKDSITQDSIRRSLEKVRDTVSKIGDIRDSLP